jgi:hypothetical protein
MLKSPSRELAFANLGRKFAGGLRVSSCLVTDSIKEDTSSLQNENNTWLGFDEMRRSVIKADNKYFVGTAKSPMFL